MDRGLAWADPGNLITVVIAMVIIISDHHGDHDERTSTQKVGGGDEARLTRAHTGHS
jgi:hypothetical protein